MSSMLDAFELVQRIGIIFHTKYMETCQIDVEAHHYPLQCQTTPSISSDGVLKFRHQKDQNNSKNENWQVINTFLKLIERNNSQPTCNHKKRKAQQDHHHTCKHKCNITNHMID